MKERSWLKHYWDELKYFEISNIVIWSSGQNEINEYGSNEDVALRISPYHQIGNQGAKKP